MVIANELHIDKQLWDGFKDDVKKALKKSYKKVVYDDTLWKKFGEELRSTLLEKQAQAINEPGVREKKGGAVIQFERRSKNIADIAVSIQDMLSATGSATTLQANQVHDVQGWMEQLLIIADELRAAKK